MDFEEDRTNRQGAIAKAQTKNTKQLSCQEVIDKIEKECVKFLDRQKMINRIVKKYTEPKQPSDKSQSVGRRIQMAEMMEEHIKSFDYQEIINEVKTQVIAEIKKRQNEVFDYENIKSYMRDKAQLKVEEIIAATVEEQNSKLHDKIDEQKVELSKQDVCNKVGDLSQKLSDCTKILDFKKEKKQSSKEEKRLFMMAKGKTEKDIILEAKDTILKMIDLYQEHSDALQKYKLRSSVFHIINSNIASEPQWEEFIVDNFSKIIQFGFKNEEPATGLIELVEKVSKINKKLQSKDNSETNYQYILDQNKEIYNQLEKLKTKCGEKEELYKNFYIFIDFIYNSQKKKEEQYREKELQAEKATRELLEEESKETGAKPKQPQQKKKKKKRSKSSSNNRAIISDKEISKPGVQNSKEEVEEIDKEVKELRKNLKELRELLLHNKNSKEPSDRELKEFIESKINQAIENYEQSSKIGASNIDDKKIKNLYVIKYDFHLYYVMYNIENYNEKYGKTIEQTKDNFGTKEFSPKDNKNITSHLIDIALIVRDVDTDLKEALLVLDKMTYLIYKDYNQQDDEIWLEMTSQENFKLMNEFLDCLKTLGEWKENKLNYVKKYNIRSNRKTSEERKNEAEAFKAIKSCIDSLDIFISKSGCTQDLNVVENDKIGYYGPYQSWEYYGPHQKWCALSKVSVEEVRTLPLEVRNCSC